MKPIFITGATGRVGSAILDLLGNDRPVRIGLRKTGNSNPRWQGFEQVQFDLEKPETYEAALKNVSRIFLMWPPVKVDYVFEFIEKAEAAGVEQIVFLSIVVAEKADFLPHRRIEKRLEASTMSYTFLRASYFMQNLDSIHRADIQELGEVFIPAGNGLLNFVDVRDVAEVAVKALTETGHERMAYSLSGCENLGFGEIARMLSQALGREIRYTDPNILRFIFWMWRKRAYPLSLVLFMVIEYSLARFKMGTDAPSQIPAILGRNPRSFVDYAYDYREAWA